MCFAKAAMADSAAPSSTFAHLVAVTQAWQLYVVRASSMLRSAATPRSSSSPLVDSEFETSVRVLCEQGLVSLVVSYFLDALEKAFKQHEVANLWQQLDEYSRLKEEDDNGSGKLSEWVQCTLPKLLSEISSAKLAQEESLRMLTRLIYQGTAGQAVEVERFLSQYHTAVSALLLTSAPQHFPEILNLFFRVRLEQFNKAVRQRNRKPQSGSASGDSEDDASEGSENNNGEDDEMESIRSSHCTSADDMEINENPSENREAKQVDDTDEARDMEGVDFVAVSHLKLGTGAATVQEVAAVAGDEWVAGVSSVICNLRHIGFAALSEEGYASAIYSLLKAKIHAITNKRYEKPVLASVRSWIEAVPLRFLSIILASSGAPSSKSSSLTFPSPLVSIPISSTGVEEIVKDGVVRWRLRLHFFAYETLGDMRISELFDIIVDYPESVPAIEDLRQCLTNSRHHAKLVDSFRTALRQRLLTAGAATTDILLQYVSTIKALRTMDPTGVVLEAVGEPIKEYLRGRKDTIRCIVTMLTDDTGGSGMAGLGGVGESLFEELSRGVTSLENVDSDDDAELDGDEAWAAAERWEPDPVEADPSRTSKSRRLMDIISMLVGIYGSKELFVNEYRVMLAEKLLNKSNYDTDRDIRTLELLKLRFGENNMHGCEIMLKDLADSKRINTNIKAAVAAELSQHGLAVPVTSSDFASLAGDAGYRAPPATVDLVDSHSQATVMQSPGSQYGEVASVGGDKKLPLDVLEATIISSLFWPPFQAETLKVPAVVEELLDEYAQRFHTIKAPRKLQWRKNLGTVKLELQFEDRSAQFVVSPMHAAIIMHFEKQTRWTATELAEAVGVPVITLRRRIMLWVNQGVLVESHTAKDGDTVYCIVETMGDAGARAGVGAPSMDAALPLLGDEERESAVASMEDQWQQEMNVYESYVIGMLTNFDSLPLDRIHNMLKMFVSDPPYDKTLQQLQGFLGRLVGEEKLEFRDGVYRRRQM